MRIIHQIKAVLVSLGLLLFVLFPTCLLALPFGVYRRLKIVCPAWKIFAEGVLKYGCVAKIAVKEDHRSVHFQITPAYGLYIANHQSYIDIPLLMTVFQVPPIMKKQVLYIPIFGWLAWISGALPVSRGSASSRKRVFIDARKRILEKKVGIQYYPEGTRSKDSLPRPYEDIKRPLMVFAFKEKIPVIPVSIYGTRGVLSSKEFINPGRHIGVIVHKEMRPEDYASANEFCHEAWRRVRQGHDELKARIAPLNGN